jgi:enoyl-CoA hydratase/carnithine racemase
VNRVVPAERLDEATHDLVTRAIRGSAESKAIGKHAFYAQVDLPQDQAYRYAIEVMAANALTADAQEGIAAFLEKRKPSFGAPAAG